MILASSLNLFDLYEMVDLTEHASDLRRLSMRNSLVHSPESQSLHRFLLFTCSPNDAANLRNFQLDFLFCGHRSYAIMVLLYTSDMDSPLLRATTDTSMRPERASIVALTTLCGLADPMHFVRIS